MAESDVTVIVRVVPGSSSARVLMDALAYLQSDIRTRSGEYENYLIEEIKKSIQVMPEDTGADLIQLERARQLFVKGFTPENDDQYDGGELIDAACAYATSAEASYFSDSNVTFSNIRAGNPPTAWPWDSSLWKRSSTPIGDLKKAGALIAAEIDRLKRILDKVSQL